MDRTFSAALVASVASVALVVVPSSHGALASQYDLVIGSLPGPAYQDSNGVASYGTNIPSPSAAPGTLMLGTVSTYTSGTTFKGRTAWIWNGGTMIPVGLSGTEYTDSYGLSYSNVGGLSQTHLVGGTTTRFSYGTEVGQAAWVYDGTGSYRVGLTDADHTNGNIQYSTINTIGTSNYTTGTSSRYSGSGTNTINNNLSSWVARPKTAQPGYDTIRLGFYDTADHSYGGYAYTAIAKAAGNYIAGTSNRYHNSTTSDGRSAWIYDGNSNTTTGLGYTGGAYVYGQRAYSSVTGLNSKGQAIGYSYNNYYTSGTESGWKGSTGWIYDSVTGYRTLGLTGGAYQGTLGQNRSTPQAINEKGWVAGYSQKMDAGDYPLSADPWLYDGQSYQTFSLSAAEFKNASGNNYITPSHLNNNGVMAGTAYRYDSSGSSWGTRPFVYHDGAAHLTGITGSPYTSSTGQMSGGIAYINDNGLVVGTMQKYNGTVRAGLSTWVYDASTETTTPLALSMNPTDNSGDTMPLFLTDEGWVGGGYTEFYDAGGTLKSRSRGFLWSSSTGLVDLTTLLGTEMAAHDITQLTAITWVTPDGTITGMGMTSNGSTVPVQFMAAVPEPSVVMTAMGVSVCALARRSRSRGKQR